MSRVVEPRSGDTAALEMYRTLSARPAPFLLEDARSAHGWPTLVGADPFALVWAKDRQIRSWNEGIESRDQGDPLAKLEEMLEELSQTAADPSKIFAVGWFGYELNQHIERLPRTALDDQNFPDLFVGFYDRVALRAPDGFRTIADEITRKRAFERWPMPEDMPQKLPRSLQRPTASASWPFPAS